MNQNFPEVSVFHVDASGDISLILTGVPYNNLQWTRRYSTVGQFSATLNCDLPFSWPGRYLVTINDRPEVGIIEKVKVDEEDSAAPPVIEGRFFESVMDRVMFGYDGAMIRGANWRQAVSHALTSWTMHDLPALKAGSGIEATNRGTSYVLAGEAGDSAMARVYGCTYDNGAYPLYTYDRATDPSHIIYNIMSGTDRRRSQSANPWWVFSLDLGDITSISYSGDYSVAKSQVEATAVTGSGKDEVKITEYVTVPGFDQATQWQALTYEDVTSLMGQDQAATADKVTQAAKLRALNHLPSITIDCTVAHSGYRDGWDLGDLCEIEIPALGLVAQERVEEVREVWKDQGWTLEATLGTKQLTRLDRALLGRR